MNSASTITAQLLLSIHVTLQEYYEKRTPLGFLDVYSSIPVPMPCNETENFDFDTLDSGGLTHYRLAPNKPDSVQITTFSQYASP